MNSLNNYNKSLLKKISSLMIATAVTVSLCACGASEITTTEKTKETSQKLTKITMVLDWTPNTNHTGLYVAQEKGYFKAEGLDVSIIQPPDDGATQLVASGGAEFGIDFQDTLASAFGADDPLPITAVGAILQDNTSGLISLNTRKITSPGKLTGHSYATWDSPIELAMLKNVVNNDAGNFDKVKLVHTTVEDIQAAFKSGIDSVWIYYGWDGIKCNIDGLVTNFISFKDMNPVFNYYSPVIIANNDYLKDNPDTAKAFMRAVSKGYTYAAQNPEDSANILLKAVPELDKELVQQSQEYISKEYMNNVTNWGIIDPDRWNGFYEWLDKNKLVDNNIADGTGFSNDYLPASSSTTTSTAVSAN